jgi:hypothetical protein
VFELLYETDKPCMPIFLVRQLISSILSILIYGTLVSQWLGGRAQAPETSVRVSGTVSDARSNQPLVGATVRNQRTQRGVVTDTHGDFALTAFTNDTLLIQSLGYKAQRLVLSGAGPSRLGLKVRLQRDSIRLGEVSVTAGRSDRATINRALNNIKRPGLPAVKGPRALKPAPLFEVDSTPPPPPPFGGGPVGLLYSKYSREGKERQKMEQIKAQAAKQKARRKIMEYNKAFKENRGYE